MSKFKEYLEALKTFNSNQHEDEKDLFGSFKKLIDQHDWTYEMSDDHRSWKSGSANLEQIQKIGNQIKNSKDENLINKASKYWNKERKKAYPPLKDFDQMF